MTAEEFAAIIDDDPYYRAPGVTIARRQEWNPIFLLSAQPPFCSVAGGRIRIVPIVAPLPS